MPAPNYYEDIWSFTNFNFKKTPFFSKRRRKEFIFLQKPARTHTHTHTDRKREREETETEEKKAEAARR